jgi:hypothetical protein
MIEFVDVNGALRGYCDTIFGNNVVDGHTHWHRGVSSAELELARSGFETSKNFLVAFVVCSHGEGDKVDLSCFDLVFVLDQELVDRPLAPYMMLLKEKFCNNNIRLVTGATLEEGLDFFAYPGLLYSSVRNQVLQDTSTTQKPFNFECLLGLQKPHRDMLFRMIKDKDMLSDTLINYTTNFWQTNVKFETIYRSAELDHYEDPTLREMFANQTFNGYKTYPNQPTFIKSVVAQMVPWQVYNASWYSLVAETWPNKMAFFTEKTTKPLFAKRIFWMFGCKGMLAKLREFGFCTFSSIVDESYDMIDDDFERIKAAYESALRISNEDPVKVYKHLQPELEYNHYLISHRQRVEKPLLEYIQRETEKHYHD